MCKGEVVPEFTAWMQVCIALSLNILERAPQRGRDTVEVKCTSYKFRTMAACLTMSAQASSISRREKVGAGGRLSAPV